LAYTVLQIFINLKTLQLGDISPVALTGYALGGNRGILIAGYRPAQAFAIERSLCAHRFGNSN